MNNHYTVDDNTTNKTLEHVLLANLKELRKTRRSNLLAIIFKYSVILIILIMIFWFKGGSDKSFINASKPHVAQINIHGAIMADSAHGDAYKIVKYLDKAFANQHSIGIMLDLDSPGGSAVQSDIIYNEIMRLKHKYPRKKVYAVINDMCASGCYYIAAAADRIYANQASLVGSIGVLFSNFGFVKAMHNVGVERRMLTAGKYKGILDPFSPLLDEHKQFLQKILNDTHNIFINKVKAGRGKKLQLSDNNLFTGLFWSGIQAKKLGLIDDFADRLSVTRDVFKNENVVNYNGKTNFFEMISQNMSMQLFTKILSNKIMY